MFRNYFKTTFRNLWKNKTYSFINIIGLSIGTLCCLYILLYVEDQYSYDKHHKAAKNIYRVTSAVKLTGDKVNGPAASPPVGPALKNDFAEVQEFTRVVNSAMMGVKQHQLRYKDKSFYEKDASFVDSTFFNVFTYHFAHGQATNALTDPYSVVLKKSTADKLFGSEDPINKVIEINNGYGKNDFKVTGVVDESLGKTHIHANMFITMNSGGIGAYVRENNTWSGNNFAATYIKLNPNADAAQLERKLPAFLNKYGQEELKAVGMEKQMHLQPVGSIHTTTDYVEETDKTVSPSFLFTLILIAVLIQIIACINFMNLSTARATKRAKEVSVRKVIGAGKKDLIKQFLSESFLLSLMGVLIALPLLFISLPYLNQITQADIKLSFLNDYRLWLMLAVLVVITGLVAGSYPAFYLSAFQVIKVLKGNFSNHASATGIRRSLVVFQFVLSIVLVGGIIIIYSQLNYINNKDLGFEKDQKLIFSFYTEDAQKKIPGLINELRQIAEVKSVSKSNNYLSQFVLFEHGVYLAGSNMTAATNVQNITTDENFTKANGIALISGRDFRVQDSGKVLINETLAKRLSLNPASAPGTRLYTQYAPDPVTFVEIAGVMKDFNYNSLHQEVRPFMLVYNPGQSDLNNLTVAVNTENYQALLNKIETIWRKNLPETPFEYTFLDEEVKKQYETEITLSRIINSFTLIAIFISCLGLFGLAAFSAEQRRKEIGVRKVLGATVFNLTTLLSKDFLKLVAISIVIATPLGWWALSQWLQQFTYRIDISWWMFALAGFIAVFIALFTVSFQAIKAAIANPVKSLRTE
ncbi:MAG: Acidobacterial duplicated orphan permease (function unknown) [uncultured Segetibacter sp.]|uniref:ABC transporter, permease protein n=1 Tax=uncultured Segetibacter sp. TaxID=481133 RepID=A0A6J4RQY3_9BACT|nr:MAG: Acidobacterial duplicated orphan permease (function unknown) [uncultured Segetibacter sp.]